MKKSFNTSRPDLIGHNDHNIGKDELVALLFAFCFVLCTLQLI